MKMKYFLIINLVLLSTGLFFLGCSELQTNIEQPQTVTAHESGIVDSDSPDFHGKLVKANNWDMRACMQCHGTDYKGGLVEQSCFTCHNQPTGPENCSTCHGTETSPAPPRDLDGNVTKTDRGVGAHQVHLAGNLKGKLISCAECHVVPTSTYQNGHIEGDIRAEVLMQNYLALLTTNDPSTSEYDSSLPLFVPNAVYNLSDQTCSNTYCHGNFKNGNPTNKPVWNDPNTSACGTCHGDPTKPTNRERALPKTPDDGGTHPTNLICSDCHGGVLNSNMNFTNPSKHIDGLLNLNGSDIRY